MAGPSWLVDSKRIATKIKNASTQGDHRRFKWKSNPTKSCPKCNHIIDNSDVVQEWPGLPQGVKFDPSDQELLWHLLAKVESETAKAHPFIDEFIPTVEEEDGICYTHPQMLPGVKTDGSVSHFFHRTFKAYNTGTRKRRKINGDNFGDVRWHKTGKTKPVIIDGKHLGCKKIMVLYMSTLKGGKPEKTNWVMHQYHLGSGEDEKDGEYVVSKIFHQQQSKPGEKSGQDAMIVVKESNSVQDPIMHLYHHGSGEDERDGEYVVSETIHQQQPNPGDKNGQDTMVVVKESIPVQDHITLSPEHHANDNDKDDMKALDEVCNQEIFYEASTDEFNNHHANKKIDDQDENAPEDNKWWEGESQFLLDSQQLAEGIAICDEFLQSQSSCNGEEVKKIKPLLADYAHMGVENLKRDLEECQKLDNLEHHNIDNEASQDFRLSQLEFGSQDSLLAWVGKELAD